MNRWNCDDEDQCIRCDCECQMNRWNCDDDHFQCDYDDDPRFHSPSVMNVLVGGIQHATNRPRLACKSRE